MSKNRAYRSSQLISPFGPGSIIEIGDESLILTDISLWPEKLKVIKLERLAREAGVWDLKKPPVVMDRFQKIDKSNSLLTVRFPKWMFCPRCRRLIMWKTAEGKTNGDGVPVCGHHACREKILVPMRFVAACNNGHLQDVPWHLWAHKTPDGYRVCEKPEIYFESLQGQGSGLDALVVRCRNPQCNLFNTLGDLLAPNALKVSCCDSQPWTEKAMKERKCNEKLQVLQRGASNLYYSVTRSALDIPHDDVSVGNSIYHRIKTSADFEDLQIAIQNNRPKLIKIYAEEIAEEFGFSVEEVLAAIKGDEKSSRTFKIPKDEDLRLAEWDVLVDDNIESRNTATFRARRAKWNGIRTFGFEKYFDKVILLDKLREVRAFCGFERISPDGNVIEMNDVRGSRSWLPATEVYGEGIFIKFSQAALCSWEAALPQTIRARLADTAHRYATAAPAYLPNPTAKFIVLHTFAHLMIRQLSFECGYASGSLRERIYTSEDQAGVLIYTADGDSDGSLGGLVQQGEASRLFPAIMAALETARWCSNDPVCGEMEYQGSMGLNKAACHACSLISETSCEYNNLLLDRKLLIGDEVSFGFFSTVLHCAEAEDYR